MKKIKLFISLFLMGALAACSSSDDSMIDTPPTTDDTILRGETITFGIEPGVGAGNTGLTEGEVNTRGKNDVDEHGKPIGKYRLPYIYLNMLTADGSSVIPLKFSDVHSSGFNVLITTGVKTDGSYCIIIANEKGDELIIPAATAASNGRRFFFSSVGARDLKMEKNDYKTIGGQDTYNEIGDKLLRSADYTVTLKNGEIQFYTLFENKWDPVDRTSILPIFMERLAGAFSLRLMFTGDYYSTAATYGALSTDPEPTKIEPAIADAFEEAVGYRPEDLICGGVMISGFPLGYNLLNWRTDPLSIKTGAAVVCPTRYDAGWGNYLSLDDPSTFLYPGSEAMPSVQGLGFACNSAPFLFPMEFSNHQQLIIYLATKDKFDEANGDWNKAFITVTAKLGSSNDSGSATHILPNQNNYIYVKASTDNLKKVLEEGYAKKLTRSAFEPIELDAEIEFATAPLAE